jgi:rod shape-determining protein MreD
MRWVPFVILAYLVTVVQTSLGRVLVFDRLAIGPVGPDFLAMLAIFAGLWVRHSGEAVLAAWGLGMLVDLTTGGGAGVVTVAGPMALAYGLGVWLLVRIREGLFRERAVPQILIAFFFVLLTHTLWALLQALLGRGAVSLATFGRTMLQILASAAYTAVLMPLAHILLNAGRGLILSAPPKRGRRSRGVRPNL